MNLSDSEIQLLSTTQLFSGYQPNEVASLLALLSAQKIAYKKGEFLHESATPLSAFGLVLSGVVQACHDDLAGRRCIMAEVPKGQTFGESLAFLSVKDSPVYITAASDCSVLWLTLPSDIFKVSKEFRPESSSEKDDSYALSINFFGRFTTMLARRTLSMNSRIQILSRPHLREKILLFLQDQSESQGSRYIHLSMNRDDMASFIGADRSALSRELSKMKDDGLIDYYKNTFELK